ncbi:cyclase family protein [bacterium]|nr:cyclase family protein [bacterium]
MNIIDISRPLSKVPPWPGDTIYHRALTNTYSAEGYETASLSMSSHAGTHLDLPSHLIANGKRLGQYTLSTFVGPALVIDCGEGAEDKTALLREADIRPGERVLLKTNNSTRSPEFIFPEYTYLSGEAAQVLVNKQVTLVGVDGPSLDHPDETIAHRTLLEAGIPAIEWLDLSRAEAGRYTLVCLPLHIPEAEGVPCRAILLPL